MNCKWKIIVIVNLFCEGEIVRAKLLLGKAIHLAAKMDGEVEVCLLGNHAAEAFEALIDERVRKYYTISYKEELLEEYEIEILKEWIQEKKTDVILYLSSDRMRTIAASLAVYFQTGLTADCIELEIEKETGLLLQYRPAQLGNVLATIVCENNRPQMAVVNPEQFSFYQFQYEKKDKFRLELLDCHEPIIQRVHLLKRELILQKYMQDQSDILITIGRGVLDSKTIDLIYELANRLYATVGATRAIIAEGRMDKKYQIGLTGNHVYCKVCIAFGVSGAVQHMMGINVSRYLIAVNQKEDAPILQIADIGIKKDCKEAVKEMLEYLNKYKIVFNERK